MDLYLGFDLGTSDTKGTVTDADLHVLFESGRRVPLVTPSRMDLDALYGDFYKEDNLVTVLQGGRQPKTSSVAGTARAHVAAVLNEHAGAIVATCAIDNVGKGAAAQAVQCANIVFGLPEMSGLNAIAIPA